MTSRSSPSLASLTGWEDHVALNDPEDGEAIAQAAGTSFNPQCNISICRHKRGRLLGGVIYTNYTRESIFAHWASFDPYWINRDMIFLCFDYPFNQLGVKRIFGQVPESNDHAYWLNSKMGFKPVARIAGVFRHNVACIVMCLERADCRLLKVKPRNVRTGHRG